jgi:pepF/M3 family oligoendopeptidase
MEQTWSLESLYASFDDPAFERDLQETKKDAAELIQWATTQLYDYSVPIEKTEGYISRFLKFYQLAYRIFPFAQLTLSVDVKHKRALQVVEKMESLFSDVKVAQVCFQRWLGGLSSFDDMVERSPVVREHRFILEEMRQNCRYLMSDQEEALAARMSETGSSAWSKLQSFVTSTLLVDIKIGDEEKKLPLPIIRNMAYDKDAILRKTAYEAELESYKVIENTSAACLNAIKGEAITLARKRGYSSVIEKTLNESRLERRTLEQMLDAIRANLPVFRRYFTHKSRLLGHAGGLPFYDVFAPVGKIDLHYTYEEASVFIIDNFGTFSAHLSNFAKNAFENRWIDALPREGKRGGAFCSNLRVIKESRIMANFSGSFGNLVTLGHELGHGFHGECLSNQTYLNSRYTMPIAETASIFSETIIKEAAYKNASQEAQISILESEICSYAQVIVDIYCRYLFETELFRLREESSVSVDQLKRIMLEAQKEAYGNGLDERYLHPYMWINKPHYYYVDNNFYNFPYAFGLLFGKGLYAEYLEKGEPFVASYEKLLSETGKNSITEIGRIAGIDVNSKEFWAKSFKHIEEKIDLFIQKTE